MARLVRPEALHYFATPLALRHWLEAHHAEARELWAALYARSAGKPSVTWPEAVDEALSFGWIDGQRQRVDAETFAIRFTPRRPGSIWSARNLRRMAVLQAEGRIRPAGAAAFAGRVAGRARIYSYEQAPLGLDAAAEAALRSDPAAWGFWTRQPPSYRQKLVWWVQSAKQAATRARRLAQLMEACAAGRRR